MINNRSQYDQYLTDFGTVRRNVWGCCESSNARWMNKVYCERFNSYEDACLGTTGEYGLGGGVHHISPVRLLYLNRNSAGQCFLMVILRLMFRMHIQQNGWLLQLELHPVAAVQFRTRGHDE